MINVEAKLSEAIRHFWRTRQRQSSKQGRGTGRRDAGQRTAVTGAKHMDGFIRLIAAIVQDAGLPDANIYVEQKLGRTLPGYFRPTKEWDLVVQNRSDLVAVVEVKSQVGSFGNNFNNRVEEALGNATDFWTAYKKGNYKPSQKPWLGYLFMLEQHPASSRARRTMKLPHYPVDPAFNGRSYSQSYELVCERLVRELLYDAACFFTSDAKDGLRGQYSEPNSELSIRNFAVSLHARAAAFVAVKRNK